MIVEVEVEIEISAAAFYASTAGGVSFEPVERAAKSEAMFSVPVVAAAGVVSPLELALDFLLLRSVRSDRFAPPPPRVGRLSPRSPRGGAGSSRGWDLSSSISFSARAMF